MEKTISNLERKRDSCGIMMMAISQGSLLLLIGPLVMFLNLPETHFPYL